MLGGDVIEPKLLDAIVFGLIEWLAGLVVRAIVEGGSVLVKVRVDMC